LTNRDVEIKLMGKFITVLLYMVFLNNFVTGCLLLKNILLCTDIIQLLEMIVCKNTS